MNTVLWRCAELTESRLAELLADDPSRNVLAFSTSDVELRAKRIVSSYAYDAQRECLGSPGPLHGKCTLQRDPSVPPSTWEMRRS